MSQLVRNLETLMKKNKINGLELAKQADLVKSAVYNILNGRSKKPSIQTTAKIASILGVSSDELLYGEQNKQQRFVTDIPFDGLLYNDSITLVRKICKDNNITFASRETEKKIVLEYARRVYNFAVKKNSVEPDASFAEDIIVSDSKTVGHES